MTKKPRVRDLKFIAVAAKKSLGAMQFCLNFIDICPNHSFLAFHKHEKKVCPKLRVKKKSSLFKS